MAKRHYKIIVIILLVCIGIGVIIALTQGNQRVFRAVRHHVNRHGESIIVLGELMDFEWETATYFRFPASPIDINQAIGATYTGETDITAGLIFVNDGEVVYYELIGAEFDFNSLWERSGRFFFNAEIPRNDTSNIRVFTRYDEFRVVRTDSGDFWMGRVVSEEEIARGHFARHEFDFYLSRDISDGRRADRDADLRRIELFVFTYYLYPVEYGFVLDMRRGGWVYYDTNTSIPRRLEFIAELREDDLDRLIEAIGASGLLDWEYYEGERGESGNVDWGLGIRFDDGKVFISGGRGMSPDSLPPAEQFNILTNFIQVIGAEILERNS